MSRKNTCNVTNAITTGCVRGMDTLPGLAGLKAFEQMRHLIQVSKSEF